MNISVLDTNYINIPFIPISIEPIELLSETMSVSNVSLLTDNPRPSTNRIGASRIHSQNTFIDFAYQILGNLSYLSDNIPHQIAYFPVDEWDIRRRARRERRTTHNQGVFSYMSAPVIIQSKIKFSYTSNH